MLSIPLAARDYADKAAYCYRAIERLRLWHNVEGAKVAAGKLPLPEFRRWSREQWEPRHAAACRTLHELTGFSTFYVEDPWKLGAKKTPTVGELALLSEFAARDARKATGKLDSSWDAWLNPTAFPRLGVVGEPPDPLEDFTGYTEVDTPGRLTVAANQVDFTAWKANEEAYVYADKGAGHFAADYTHVAKASYTDLGSNTYPSQWMLSSVVDNWYDIINGGGKAHAGAIYKESVCKQHLEESIGTTGRSIDRDTAGSFATPYWNKFVRNEAIGTYGTLYGYWYTDAARTNLLSSQTLTLREKADFRYVFPLNQYVFASAGAGTGYSAELDLGEQSVVPLCQHEYFTRRGR